MAGMRTSSSMHASLYSRAAEESALVLTSTKFQEEGTVRSKMEHKCYDSLGALGKPSQGMAQREIGEVSIIVPHTRKSLVKGERFIRECMKDLSYARETNLPRKYPQVP